MQKLTFLIRQLEHLVEIVLAHYEREQLLDWTKETIGKYPGLSTIILVLLIAAIFLLREAWRTKREAAASNDGEKAASPTNRKARHGQPPNCRSKASLGATDSRHSGSTDDHGDGKHRSRKIGTGGARRAQSTAAKKRRRR